MKYIAYYLPQFHTIPENDKWWGDGFTEWTNVKKALPLFEGHSQPKVPMNNNYYNLLEKKNLEWQSELAINYDVYGFCFYHYWFKNSKKLLEKPAEILLENKNINLRYCFSWANEPWTRSWDGKNGEVIMEQDYGTEEDWKDHFYYLLPFFKDSRYIRMDGKPVFVIYKPDSFDRINKMLDFWDELCKVENLPGIYFIKTLRSRENDQSNNNFDAGVEFEPAYTNYNLSTSERIFRKTYKIISPIVRRGNNSLKLLKYDYDKVTKESLKKRPLKDLKTIPGIFVNWDNTARKGDNGIVFKNFNLKQFESYLLEKSILAKEVYNSEYLFINAWNEWAEGAYLEPDEEFGYGYLESIKKVNEKMID